MPQDRSLSILCTANCYYNANGPSGPGYYGGLTYSFLSSTPPIPTGVTVVASSGEIDIGAWANPDPTAWNDIVDIVFSLAGQCTTQDGQQVAVTWSPNMNNDPNGQPAMLLMESDMVTPAPTSDVAASWVAGSNNTQILVDDNNESKDYYFRPAIVIPALNNYYISFDPVLKNRGTG